MVTSDTGGTRVTRQAIYTLAHSRVSFILQGECTAAVTNSCDDDALTQPRALELVGDYVFPVRFWWLVFIQMDQTPPPNSRCVLPHAVPW
jgi:hypothetical protein